MLAMTNLPNMPMKGVTSDIEIEITCHNKANQIKSAITERNILGTVDTRNKTALYNWLTQLNRNGVHFLSHLCEEANTIQCVLSNFGSQIETSDPKQTLILMILVFGAVFL